MTRMVTDDGVQLTAPLACVISHARARVCVFLRGRAGRYAGGRCELLTMSEDETARVAVERHQEIGEVRTDFDDASAGGGFGGEVAAAPVRVGSKGGDVERAADHGHQNAHRPRINLEEGAKV